MDEGDLASAIKRLPAIAMQRRNMAERLRQIRRMNRGVARYLLGKERADRQQAAQDWWAELIADVPVGELTASAILDYFLAQILPRSQPTAMPAPPVGTMDEEQALAELLRTVERASG